MRRARTGSRLPAGAAFATFRPRRDTAININIYLTFDDNCRAAFEFYRSVFGGEFSFIQTFADAPHDIGVPADKGDLIMHVSLPIGSGVLMGSDSSGFGPEVTSGNNFSVSISPDSREQADDLFAKLAAGGAATMPMEEQFWGAYFGTCTDQFGINWMINYELPRG